VLRKNHIIVARICDNCKKEVGNIQAMSPTPEQVKEEKIDGKKGFLKKGTIITDENDIENKGD